MQPHQDVHSPRRTTKSITVVICAIIAVSTAGFTLLARSHPAAADASSNAVSAYSLINSVGVNVHMSYNDTTYADADTVTKLVTALGIRHVRDGLQPNRPDQIAALSKLGKAGVSLDMVIGGAGSSASQAIDSSRQSELDALAPYLDSVEDPNEYDCSGDANWLPHLRSNDRALASAVASDPALRSVPILGPSFCQTGSVVAYGAQSDSATVTNNHDYSGGAAPEMALEGRIPGNIAIEGPGMPTEITETGFHNATNATNGQPPVSEQTAADYDVRLLLDSRRIGVDRTYLYELLDEKPNPDLSDPEEHFGLVRNDGTVKPAYQAVANLLDDISDGDPNAVSALSASTSFPVRVQGGGSLLRSLTIADPDGSGETIALWLNEPLENTTTHTRLPNSSTTVRLQLPGTYNATVRRPSNGNELTPLGRGTSVDVPINGQVSLVHLDAGGVTPAATSGCSTTTGYTATAQQLGAVVSDDLDPSTGWSGSPAADNSAPDDPGTGAQVTADGQTTHVTVSGAPVSWTIGLWERTDSSSRGFATFVQVSRARGAQLRTYDLTGDAPSHEQLSAYGLPVGANSYGYETWGQALVGTWHFIALSDDGQTATLSVDGVVQSSTPSSSQALTALDVGAVSDGFRGSLSGLEVFPTALDAEDLLALAAAAPQTCPATSGPTAAPTSDAPVTNTPVSSAPATGAPATGAPATTVANSPISAPSGEPTSPAASASNSTAGVVAAPTPSGSTTAAPTTATTSSRLPQSVPKWRRAQLRSHAPARVKTGAMAELSARLTAEGRPVSQARIQLFRRLGTHGPLVLVRSMRTSKAGLASLRIRVSYTSFWLWHYAGSRTTRAVNSRVYRTKVVASKHAGTRRSGSHHGEQRQSLR